MSNNQSMFFLVISIVIIVSCLSIQINNVQGMEKGTSDADDWQKSIQTNGGLSNLFFSALGLKWCGQGDLACNYEDLGYRRETDMCCRSHDQCDDYIAGGGTKHGLTNKASYSRLTCDCDEKFRHCLRKVDGWIASIIGDIYFNRLGTKCFRLDYPVKECINHKEGWWYFRAEKCLAYRYNNDASKIYQWFDLPDY